jgi:hypothetical protein
MSLFSPFSILNIDSYAAVKGATLSTDEGLSNLLSSLVPDFVLSDHPTFVAFLKAYFEFIEQEGNSRFAATTLEKNVDVDQTLEQFISYFKDQYLHEFPKNLESGIDDRFLVKKIKNYYQEKGNPRSLDLLFRILFGVSADVELPREKILVLSEAVIDQRPKIVLTNYQGIVSFTSDESYQIKQTVLEDPSTGLRASAFLDDVKVLNYNGTNFIYADLVEVQGTFSTDVPVQILGTSVDNEFEQVVPIFSEVLITNGGSGYSRGDTIVIKDSRNRIVETTKIKSVSNTGGILTIEKLNQSVIDVGTYEITIESPNGSGAVLSLGKKVATFTKPQVFRSQKNLISSDSFVQDNNKYQQFSYIIKAEKSLFDYSSLVQKLFHPAGVKFFGQFNFAKEFALKTATADTLAGITGGVSVRPVVGHYFPYTMGTTSDLRGDTFGSTFADYYPTGFNGLTAATLGSFTADGRAITHDPFNKGTFVTGPLGGNTGGTFNPDFYSTGVTKLGYVPITQTQLRMIFADSVTAPFFNIYRHPKNMEVTDTIFAADEAQYSSGDIEDEVVELFFDASYDAVSDPHSYLGYPVVGDVAIQKTREYDIGGVKGSLSQPRLQAFGTILSIQTIPNSDTRYSPRGSPGVQGLAFKSQVRVHDGEFINTGYKRFPTENQEGYVEFFNVTPVVGTRTLRGKRFISQTSNQSNCIKNLGVTSATFEFQDIKCGDFMDRMRLTDLGVTGSTADLGITFPVV